MMRCAFAEIAAWPVQRRAATLRPAHRINSPLVMPAPSCPQTATCSVRDTTSKSPRPGTGRRYRQR